MLRFDFDFTNLSQRLPIYLLLALTIKLPIFHLYNLNRGWWRYTSLSDMVDVFKATLAAQVVLGFLHWASVSAYFPRSTLIIDFFMTLLFLGGARLVFRWIHETNFQDARRRRRRSDGRVLIVGAGDAGMSLLRQLRKSDDFHHEVVGFIDDSRMKLGVRLHGVPILGCIEDITDLVVANNISEVYIAIPSLKKSALQRIADKCIEAKVTFKTIPSIKETLEFGSKVFRLREVKVEDLLGREPIHLDKAKTMGDIRGAVVLVTGAGGSIGSELCRQVLSFSPKRLILFERSEYNLFSAHRSLKRRFGDAEIIPVVGDMLDRPGLTEIFSNYKPDLVYHAAAHKHVNLMEMSPREAVRNNVFGTRNLAEASVLSGVKKFVMISTDKAVNPLSIMGYSKRMAELVIQSFARSRTTFISVRFGNVLGSSGSVVEIFRKQIEHGGPVTVTHPDATRFFMTTPEAVELVLHAGSHGQSEHIYMLDMGQPVRVMDLARKMIQLSDPEGKREIEVITTGLWPGEKLQEELVWNGEDFVPSEMEKVFILKNKIDVREVPPYLMVLEDLLSNTTHDIGSHLKSIVDAIDARSSGVGAPIFLVKSSGI